MSLDTHKNFVELRQSVIDDFGQFYDESISVLAWSIRACYGEREVSLQQLAATFRRGDLLEMLAKSHPTTAP